MKYLILLYLYLGDSIYARSIKATTDRLGSEAKNIGISLAILGLAVGGIMLALGKQDASSKITQAIIGCLIIAMSSNIVSFIKGLV